jgi:hypothetical protein
VTRQQPTTVAILGANTLVDRILTGLLEHEGYDTKFLEAPPTGHIDELLNGVDVLLLSPYLDADERWGLLNALRSTSEAAQRIPVLSLSVPLQVALLDELAINVSWQSLFEGLVQEIEAAALRRSEVSVATLPVDAGEPLKESPRSSKAA